MENTHGTKRRRETTNARINERRAPHSHITLDADQMRAIDAALLGKNIFITGAGGTGKTALVEQLVDALEQKKRKVQRTATTGIAAVALRGKTLHSFCGLGLGRGDLESILRRVAQRPSLQQQWRDTHALIIDEVSMLDPLFFIKIDQVARLSRRCDQPFGGMQLIAIGDFCQLPPVKPNEGKVVLSEHGLSANTEFCFELPLWRDLFSGANGTVVYLTKMHRQCSETDAPFVRCLANARMGRLTEDDIDILQQRMGFKWSSDDPIEPTVLYSLNRNVDRINTDRLLQLDDHDQQQYTLSSSRAPKGKQDAQSRKKLRATEQMMIKNVPVDIELKLRVGAQVMLVANLCPDAGLINGSRGVVESFANDDDAEGSSSSSSRVMYPVVRFRAGMSLIIRPWVWNTKTQEGDISISAVPLRLAYALTIHKSQSQTLDRVVLSLAKIWSPGQAYVGLSRVTMLDGLSLSSFDPVCIKAHPKVQRYYDSVSAQVQIESLPGEDEVGGQSPPKRAKLEEDNPQ